MTEFWITDIRYGNDGRIDAYGVIPAPIWAQIISGREASARAYVRPVHLDEMSQAGIEFFTTIKAKNGRSVMRGPKLDAGRD